MLPLVFIHLFDPLAPLFSSSVCGEHGELTCCDFCPRVFHEECLVLGSDSQLAAEHQTDDDPWYCPSCVGAGQINLIAGVRCHEKWERVKAKLHMQNRHKL